MVAEAVIYFIEGLPGRDGSSFDPRQYMPESLAPRRWKQDPRFKITLFHVGS